jgi:hypothetical protein
MKSPSAEDGLNELFDKLYSDIQTLKENENPADPRSWDYASPLVLASYHLSACRNLLSSCSRTSPPKRPRPFPKKIKQHQDHDSRY